MGISFSLAHFRILWYNFLIMAQTMTVSAESFEKIISRLDQLTREVKAIKVRLFEKEPTYGSKEWWEWSDRKALEDIKAGRFVELKNAKETQEYLNSLKSA